MNEIKNESPRNILITFANIIGCIFAGLILIILIFQHILLLFFSI